VLGPDSVQVAIDLLGLGVDFVGMGAPRRARAPLERAVAIFEREPREAAGANLADARFALARALASEPRELERAQRLAGDARDFYRGLPRGRPRELDDIERWLEARSPPPSAAR
jgi:hypothetical protein